MKIEAQEIFWRVCKRKRRKYYDEREDGAKEIFWRVWRWKKYFVVCEGAGNILTNERMCA